MASPESFDTTHERLRELLVGTSPAEAAGELLAQGHAPLHVLHALVTETKPAVVGALDHLVREKAACIRSAQPPGRPSQQAKQK